MKNQINRELIEALNESNNPEFLDNINSKVFNIVENAVEDVSMKSPFIKSEKCYLLPVNEVYTGAIAQLSEYTYFLGIENPQIELNSKKKSNFWKNLWREFKANWRLGKRKYKPEKHGPSVTPVTKYDLKSFRHDMANALSEYLDTTSIIYEYPTSLSLVGAEDFGTDIKINIIVCCYDFKKKIFKLYNQRRNKYWVVDFGKRFENISLKTKECGLLFIDMIRIFNALYSKAYSKLPNQILVESLVYNCPKLLFNDNDLYETFVNVANYIRLTKPQSLISICNGDKNIFQEELITKNNAQVEFNKIIGMLDRFQF